MIRCQKGDEPCGSPPCLLMPLGTILFFSLFLFSLPLSMQLYMQLVTPKVVPMAVSTVMRI